MFVNDAPYLQQFDNDFTQRLKDEGWENFLSYRAVNDTSYARVKLYRSYGSDNQLRHFGLTWGYDTVDTQFKDERMISEGSPLGLLGVSDGSEKTYKIPVYPVDLNQFALFDNGRRVNPNLYKIDNDKGEVKYKADNGNVITANYRLGDEADDPPTFLTFFLFDNVLMEAGGGKVAGRVNPDDVEEWGAGMEVFLPEIPIDTDTMDLKFVTCYWTGVSSRCETTQLELGVDYQLDPMTGIIKMINPLTTNRETKYLTYSYEKTLLVKSKVTFNDGEKTMYLPTDNVMDEGFKVVLDGVETDDFSLDNKTGQLTINPPYEVAEVVFLDDSGNAPIGESEIVGDVNVPQKIDPDNTQSLMDAVYSSLHYISPSMPSVIDFTSETEFSKAWQRDSQITMQGHVNKDRIVMSLRADPTGSAGTTLFSPLYIGRLRAVGKEPRNNTILLCGSNNKHELKYRKGLELGKSVVDYGPGTANGNSGVMLGQAFGGARYQTHHLKFFTFGKDADPTGEGRFNKSRWTGRYHISMLGIEHPNDGMVGYLDDVLAVHPKGIYQGDELETGVEQRLERVGIGDGKRTVFYPSYHPVDGITVEVDCDTVDDFWYDEETKAIRLKKPAPAGADVHVKYKYSSLYQFFLPTAPRCAFTLKEYSPYVPMGMAFLKDNDHTPKA